MLWIHPEDAAARGITDGSFVRLWNERGEVRLRARLTEDIVRGTVLAPGIWWNKLSPDGRNINQVTPADESDMGGGARFYDVLVRVAPVANTRAGREAMAAPLPITESSEGVGHS